jgi:hypothetical protein
MRRIAVLSVIFSAILVLGAMNAFAFPVPAVDFTTPLVVGYTTGTWSLGFEFNVLNPITVTQLGFYDDSQNDLTEGHDVGIWDPNGNLLVSGTVVPGDSLAGWFRWHAVTPTQLLVGQGYRIAAETGSEYYTWNPLGLTADPNIEFINSRETYSNTLVYPLNLNVGNGIFGPNFGLESSSVVPEPASLSLLGLGLFGLAFRRKKAR